MEWNDSADRWALAEWVISTWTDDELREYAIGTVLAKYLLDPGQFEGDLELKKAKEEEEEKQ